MQVGRSTHKPEMEEIIKRYKTKNNGKYIFPNLSDKRKNNEYATRDYLYKLFKEGLNMWLKCVSKDLGFKMHIYAYSFVVV